MRYTVLDSGVAATRKARSLSASEGIAARDDYGPTTLIGTNTSAMSKAPTLERQHLTVPTDPLIRFEEGKKSLSELTRTPTEHVERLQCVDIKSTCSTGFDDNKLAEAEATQTTQNPVSKNWYSRFFTWGRKAKTQGDVKGLC